MRSRMNWSSSSAAGNRHAKGSTPQSSAATRCCGSSSAQVPIDERGMTDPASLSPVLAEFAAFRAFRSDAARWLPMAHDIARSHGVPWSDPVVFAAGTNLVVGIGDRLILKIFPPLLVHQFISERATLRAVAGRLRLDVPEIIHEGACDGWPYLIMTRLSGVLASEVWPEVPEPDKERVLRQLGAVIAEMQLMPPGELTQI